MDEGIIKKLYDNEDASGEVLRKIQRGPSISLD